MWTAVWKSNSHCDECRSSTPSTRCLLDGVVVLVPHRSTELERPRHRREMTVHPTRWLISTQVDEVSGADFMGQFTVDLGPLTDHKPVRRWYQLQEAEGRKGEVAGHIELFLQWVYNPVTAFDPFAPSETDGEPNELRIGLGLCGN